MNIENFSLKFTIIFVMKLSEEIKEEIKRESEEYLNEIKSGTDQYGGLTREERDKLGAFYTKLK